MSEIKKIFCFHHSIPRSAIAALSVLALSGCYGHGRNVTEVQFDADCTELYQASGINLLRGKIPIQPGDLPSRNMLMSAGAPSSEEIDAIKQLEEADRTCKEIRAKNGNATSATEDILASHVSKLRYGLFKGDIPYAVYNLGIARAVREQVSFATQGHEAFAKGKEIGAQKAAQFTAQMQQIQTQAQLNSIQGQLNSYNTTSSGYWNCTATSLSDTMASVSCY